MNIHKNMKSNLEHTCKFTSENCFDFNLIRYGVRKNKYQPKQIFKCNLCKKFFTANELPIKSLHDSKIIKYALGEFCKGRSYKEIAIDLNRDFDKKISKSTIHRWVTKTID
jgi:hypothetical protein